MQFIPPEQLAAAWTWVRGGVEHVLREQAPHLLPEDVYHALRSGTAWLYAVEDRGFLVLQRHTDVDGSAALFVWLAWGALAESRAELMSELNAMARTAQCRVLRGQSNRKGWARAAGWKLTGYVYECEVT